MPAERRSDVAAARETRDNADVQAFLASALFLDPRPEFHYRGQLAPLFSALSSSMGFSQWVIPSSSWRGRSAPFVPFVIRHLIPQAAFIRSARRCRPTSSSRARKWKLQSRTRWDSGKKIARAASANFPRGGWCATVDRSRAFEKRMARRAKSEAIAIAGQARFRDAEIGWEPDLR